MQAAAVFLIVLALIAGPAACPEPEIQNGATSVGLHLQHGSDPCDGVLRGPAVRTLGFDVTVAVTSLPHARMPAPRESAPLPTAPTALAAVARVTPLRL